MGVREGGSYTVDPKSGAERLVERTEAPPAATVKPDNHAADAWTSPAPTPAPAEPEKAPEPAPASAPATRRAAAPASQE